MRQKCDYSTSLNESEFEKVLISDFKSDMTIISAVILLCVLKTVSQQVYFPQDYSSLYERERMQATFWQMYNNLYHFKSHNHPVHPPPVQPQSSSSQQNLDIRQSPSTHHKFINSIEQRKCEPKMDIDYIGLMAWLLFSVFVLLVGVWAGCTRTRRGSFLS